MRAGLAFSGVCHMALLLWGFLLFANPRPFTPVPPEAITVDLVPAAAIAQELEPLRPESAGSRQSADREPGPDTNPTRTASAVPEPASVQAHQQRPTPDEPRARPPQPQSEPRSDLLVFHATVPPVPDVPLATGGVKNPAGGFDAPDTAKLSAEEVAALRAHLQQCWSPPAGVDAQKLRVVLRVAFKPDGSLTGSPTLIEASASEHGPALVAAATNALRACQPYGFLPAAKYQEWKLLDLSFSPRGLS